jgi:SAM-dependent methyltransferase
MDEVLLIFSTRPSRRKAGTTAVAEALALLGDLGASAPTGGPLAEQAGIFWISLPPDSIDAAQARLPRLGYTEAVDSLELLPRKRRSRKGKVGEEIFWHGQLYKLKRLYQEDAQAMREMAPDRRTFAYSTTNGEVRQIRGYRGGGDPLTRRGLPVCDARLLVNLVYSAESTIFLDPFGGVGGIILEAYESGYQVVSCDRDSALRYGLKDLGDLHCVANAARLPISSRSISAIATEPPYHPEADTAVISSLKEMYRVLKKGGRVSMLCAYRQVEGIKKTAAYLGLLLKHDASIDRKNLACAILVFEK